MKNNYKILSFSKFMLSNYLKDHLPVALSVNKSKSIIYRDGYFPKSLKICFASQFFPKTFSTFLHIPVGKKLTSTDKTSYNTTMKKLMHIGRLFRQPCAIIYRNFRFEKTYYSYLLYKGWSSYLSSLNVDSSHVYAFH